MLSRLLFIMAFGLQFAACVRGGAYAQRSTIRPNSDYDRCYTAAIQAMSDVGELVNEDRRSGVITGRSTSGMNVSVLVNKSDKGDVEMRVRASVPLGIIATRDELDIADHYMDAYRQRVGDPAPASQRPAPSSDETTQGGAGRG